MSREKGCKKTGGRVKGTPNRVTSNTKEWVSDLLHDNRDRFKKALRCMQPSEYARTYINLLGFVLPKQQMISAEAMFAAEYRELEMLMDKLPDEFVDKIALRIKKLESQSSQFE